jgi:hypothetical protein
MIFLPLVMLWVFTLIDVFQRSDLSGIAKALWAIAVVLLPLVGMLVYFLLRDDGASTPERRTAASSAAAPDTADRLERLAELRDKNVLTDEEFQREKDKILGSGPS